MLEIKINRLVLFGHYHGDNSKTATSHYSWPTGTPLNEAVELIKSFSRAFHLTTAELSSEPRRA